MMSTTEKHKAGERVLWCQTGWSDVRSGTIRSRGRDKAHYYVIPDHARYGVVEAVRIIDRQDGPEVTWMYTASHARDEAETA